MMRGACGVCVWTVATKGNSEASSSMRDVAVGRSAPAQQLGSAGASSLSTLKSAAGVGLQEEAASWRWQGPMWKLVVSKIRRFPWISNVVMYSTVFTAGDVVQQSLFKKEPLDLKRTRNVTTLALTFHGNFVYLWLKAMENVFPGSSMGTVLRKLVCDQLIATPTGISAYYIGMSILDGKQDIFADWKAKFWSTEKAAMVYWSIAQIINYSLVPVFFRMAYFGCWGFVWMIFMSHLRHQNNGLAASESPTT